MYLGMVLSRISRPQSGVLRYSLGAYVPVGRMSATCIPSNGTWAPDPADLMCIGERQLAHTLHGLAVSRQLLGMLDV